MEEEEEEEDFALGTNWRTVGQWWRRIDGWHVPSIVNQLEWKEKATAATAACCLLLCLPAGFHRVSGDLLFLSSFVLPAPSTCVSCVRPTLLAPLTSHHLLLFLVLARVGLFFGWYLSERAIWKSTFTHSLSLSLSLAPHLPQPRSLPFDGKMGYLLPPCVCALVDRQQRRQPILNRIGATSSSFSSSSCSSVELSTVSFYFSYHLLCWSSTTATSTIVVVVFVVVRLNQPPQLEAMLLLLLLLLLFLLMTFDQKAEILLSFSSVSRAAVLHLFCICL